jgi:hypothetical protein
MNGPGATRDQGSPLYLPVFATESLGVAEPLREVAKMSASVVKLGDAPILSRKRPSWPFTFSVIVESRTYRRRRNSVCVRILDGFGQRRSYGEGHSLV